MRLLPSSASVRSCRAADEAARSGAGDAGQSGGPLPGGDRGRQRSADVGCGGRTRSSGWSCRDRGKTRCMSLAHRDSIGQATAVRAWRVLGPPPPAPRIAIAADGPLLLAGSRAACGRAEGKNSPLYQSRDEGATWQSVAGIDDSLPLAIWGEPGLALGATCSGLQVSTDGGLTWRLVPAIPADYLVTGFAPASDQLDVPAFFSRRHVRGRNERPLDHHLHRARGGGLDRVTAHVLGRGRCWWESCASRCRHGNGGAGRS